MLSSFKSENSGLTRTASSKQSIFVIISTILISTIVIIFLE